jgi:hypothetical protein
MVPMAQPERISPLVAPMPQSGMRRHKFPHVARQGARCATDRSRDEEPCVIPQKVHVAQEEHAVSLTVLLRQVQRTIQHLVHVARRERVVS